MRISFDPTEQHGDAPPLKAGHWLPSSVSSLSGPSRGVGQAEEVLGASTASVTLSQYASSSGFLPPKTHASVTIATSPCNLALVNETGAHPTVTAQLQGGAGVCDTAKPTDTARILRAQRLDELLSGIAEWRRATGPERSYARRNARYDLREWRRLYEAPEAAAFLAAVARIRASRGLL